MKEFSVFVITAAACVFFLTGCGVASDSTSSVEPDTPHTESTAQPTATPIITPAPDAESSEAVEKSLFDPASADYTGSVVEIQALLFLRRLSSARVRMPAQRLWLKQEPPPPGFP